MADYPIIKPVLGITIALTSIFSLAAIISILFIIYDIKDEAGNKANYTTIEKIKKILFVSLLFIPQIGASILYYNL